MLPRYSERYAGRHRLIVGRHRRKEKYAPRHRALIPGLFLLKTGVLSAAIGGVMLIFPVAIDLGTAKAPRAKQSLDKAMDQAPAVSLGRESSEGPAASHWPATASPGSKPPETLLIIPDISLEKKLNYAPADEKYQLVSLRTGPTHYGGTALPGSSGNVAIGGHNGSAASLIDTSFRRLSELSPGAEIYLSTKDHTYRYAVKETVVVNEGDVRQVIDYGRGATITLYTCTPRTNPFLRPTTRLVVRGVLESVDGRERRGVIAGRL